MKRIWLAIVLAIVATAVPVVASAIPSPDSTPAVLSMKGYRNLLEPEDRLFVVYSNNPYASIPTDPATLTFMWEFVDADGVTVLGCSSYYDYVDSGYGYQVISFYFPASAGVSWNPGSAYTIRLRGSPIAFTTPPVYDFTLQPSNYTSLTSTADVQSELAADVLVISEDLDRKWGLSISLISEEETGQVLSTFGQSYFRGTIYSIQALAPALFPLAIRNIDISKRTWTDAYQTALAHQYHGTWIDTAKAAGGTLFGLDYDLASLILLLVMVVGVIIGDAMITNTQWTGLMDAAFVLVVSARIDLIGLGYVILLAAMALIYMATRIWSMMRT